MTHIERKARPEPIVAMAVAWRDLMFFWEMFFWKMFDNNARRAEAWLRGPRETPRRSRLHPHARPALRADGCCPRARTPIPASEPRCRAAGLHEEDARESPMLNTRAISEPKSFVTSPTKGVDSGAAEGLGEFWVAR